MRVTDEVGTRDLPNVSGEENSHAERGCYVLTAAGCFPHSSFPCPSAVAGGFRRTLHSVSIEVFTVFDEFSTDFIGFSTFSSEFST